MLQEMRKYTRSWPASILLGAIALSFVVWGIADVFKGSTDSSVATVGGTAIGADVYQREYNDTLKNQVGPDGKPMSSDLARKLKVPDQVLQSMIGRTALDEVVKRLGLTTSDAILAGDIRNIRGFQGPLGGFDHNTFLRVITDRGYTEQEFLDTMRSDMTREQLLDAARGGFEFPAGYTAALFAFLNEVRAADFVVLPASAAGAIPAPTDAQLQDYMKKNPGRFSTPEYREVDFAEIAPDDVANQVQVTDAQLRQQYELRKDDPRYAYAVPEKRDVEQITFANQAGAAAAKAKLDGGTSFADLAKSLGKTVDSLGTVSKDDLGTRGPATFSVAEGGVTAPQKNISGWVLLHVTKITPAVNKTFDDVKADIRKDVLAELETAKLGDIANAYTDANSGGMSLIEAGKKIGMHTGHIAAVDANGLAPDGSKTPAADDPDFLKQIFAAEIGEDGDPFPAKSGRLYVLKVDGQTPPKLKPLDAVRAQATAAWMTEQQEKALAAKADALAKQATSSKSLAAVSAAAGAPVQQSGRLERPTGPDTSGNPALPALFVAKLFQIMPGTAIAGPAPNGSYIVARVTGVYHPPIPMGSLEFLQGSMQISKQADSDFDETLAQAARNKVGVSVNQANADRVTGEGS